MKNDNIVQNKTKFSENDIVLQTSLMPDLLEDN